MIQQSPYGTVFIVDTPNTETTGELFKQIASLLNVGPRTDGKYYLSDICQTNNANLWAKYKSFRDRNPNFPDAATRDEARLADFYGIGVEFNTMSDNSYVRLLAFSRSKPSSGYNPPYYSRLRDWHGYSPTAVSSVLLKSHDTATIQSDITLETNPQGPFNVNMINLLKYLKEYRVQTFSTFRWVLVDPFGFLHELGSQSFNEAGIEEYLYGSTFSKVVVNITNNFKGKAYNNYQAIPSPNRPLGSPSWTLGLMAWTSKDERYILNPKSFVESSFTTCPVRISGFTPNMTIGTAYMGRTTLKDLLYNNGGESGAIACCSDDYVFMGFTMTNMTSSVFNATNIRMLFINNIASVRPYQTNVAVYNQASFSVPINPNASIGNGGGLGTAWANGMLYFRVTNMWNIATNGFFALAYVGSNNQVQLLTPYIPITFKNKGVTVASINDSLKATLPSVKPVDNTWSTTIVTQ